MSVQLFILIFAVLSFQPMDLEVGVDAEEVILEKATSAIQHTLGDEPVRVELSARWIPGSLRKLRAGSIQSVRMMGGLKKYTRFEVSYTELGQKEEAEIQLQVEMEVKVPVLIQRKQRGEILEASDLEMRWVSLDLNRDQPIKDSESLMGKTLRHSLNAGSFIQADEIGRRYLVEAGEVVNMFFQQNGIHIEMSCESRQDGARGEEIQVYCKETRKKYTTKIISTGEVEWLHTN